MTASRAAESSAYENPLMPHARLRQMYVAMLRLRMLAGRVGSQPRRTATPVGMEACLVAPAIDLQAEDLVCDTLEGGAIDFLRGRSAEQVLTLGRHVRSLSTLAECGAATRLIASASDPERLWMAAGASAALKASSLSSDAKDSAVLVCYAQPSDAQPSSWLRVLERVSAQKLPLLFVLLPERGSQSSRTGRMSAIALRSRVPGIPVDQDDAVAIYRVAQEAIGHARIGGGGALIECVRYAVEGQKQQSADAIQVLAEYMLHRNVAEKRWMEAEAKSFARRIGFRLASATSQV